MSDCDQGTDRSQGVKGAREDKEWGEVCLLKNVLLAARVWDVFNNTAVAVVVRSSS